MCDSESMYAAVAVESVYACVSLWQCVYLNAQSDSVLGSGSEVTLASVHACVSGCMQAILCIACAGAACQFTALCVHACMCVCVGGSGSGSGNSCGYVWLRHCTCVCVCVNASNACRCECVMLATPICATVILF